MSVGTGNVLERKAKLQPGRETLLHEDCSKLLNQNKEAELQRL